jgi:CubicO group peptidase (beta-lactamase class C family)
MNTIVSFVKRHTPLAIVALLLCLTPSAVRATSPANADPDFAVVDTYVEAQMKAARIPGVALAIVHGDQIVHLNTYGVADPAGRAMTPQTPFRLASVSKTLTALAVMQLVEDGRIDLDAPVQRYLPWFRLADEQASALITVRHLLYHTSGVPQSAGYDNLFNGDQNDTALEHNVRQLAGVAPNRPIGAAYQYANLNYDVLGLVVQVVSGQTYEAYIQDHIFDPLAMNHSYTSQADAKAHGLATGYRRWVGFPIPIDLPDDRATRPSSFLISSAEDLGHLLIAELNGGRYDGTAVLSPEGMAATQQPVIAIGDTGLRSGMGLEVGEVNGVNMAAKTGGTANYNARLVLMPDSGWGVVVLANTFDIGLGDQFDALANEISAWLINGQPPEVVQAPIGGGSATLKFALIAIVIFEIVSAFRTRIVLPVDPHDRRWLVRHLGLPLVWDAALALIVLVAAPRFINMPLNFLFHFAPDIFWLLVVVVAIPFSKDILKALITLRRLQTIHAASTA